MTRGEIRLTYTRGRGRALPRCFYGDEVFGGGRSSDKIRDCSTAVEVVVTLLHPALEIIEVNGIRSGLINLAVRMGCRFYQRRCF